MPYCTQTVDDELETSTGDIAPAKLSDAQLMQLTSEDGASIVQSVIDAAIAEADADIDSYAGRRYTVPFTTVPAKVKQLSVAISVYKLYEKRTATFGEVPKTVRDMYEDAIAFLKDVAKGNAVIDGAVTPTANPNRTGGSFSANDRVFSKDSMGKL